MEAEPKHTVLIIDDEAEFARLISQILESEGYSTLLASTGNDGVTLARLHHPSLVITDFFLPGISGATVIRKLKRDPNTASIPVLLLSGSDPSIFSGINADGFLAKPFKIPALVNTVRSLTNGALRPEFAKN